MLLLGPLAVCHANDHDRGQKNDQQDVSDRCLPTTRVRRFGSEARQAPTKATSNSIPSPVSQ